jgi:hypothetical protein
MVRLSRDDAQAALQWDTQTDPETASMTPVEAREINPPANEEPLRCRMLTTIEVGDAAAACEIVRLYRLNWRIDIDRHGDSQESSGGRVRPATRHLGGTSRFYFQSRPNPRGGSASDS